MVPITNTQAKLFDKKFVALALRDFRRCDKCKREYDIKFKVTAADNKPNSSRPVLLNCGHNICENCIYQHRHNLTCAVCLAPTEFEHTRWLKKSYDLNFCLLGQLMNAKSFLSSEPPGSSGYVQSGMLAQDSFVQKCSECEQAPAVGLCMHCKVDFCKRCFISVHQNSKVLKQHKLSEFEIQTLQLQLPKEKICKMHKRLCDKFCTDCSGIYCLQCIRAAHGSHRVFPLSAENENHKNRIISFLETMKQTRESIRKAQKEARICENQLEDFATEVILEVSEYFLELHNHLQLEERRILDEFKKSARGSQKAILEAFSRLSDSQTTLNNMKSSLQGYIHKPPHNFHINSVLELATAQLEQMPCQIQISAIEKSPFTFKKLKNLQEDISSSYEVTAIDPKLKIRITPMYGDLAHTFETSSDRASSPEPLCLTRMESMDNYYSSVVSTSLSSAVPIGKSKRIGRITNIISPSEFFVHEEDAIGKIRLLLDKFDVSSGHVESVNVGKLYLVYHVADQAWFRGIVRNDPPTEKLPKNCENLKFKVFLIDYGIFEDISKKWFREMSEELSAIPAAAVACKLLDITPAEGQWTKEARELMEEIIQNKPVQVLIQDTTKFPWNVEVFTLHTGDPISLREAFLYTGLGIDTSAASSQRNAKFAGTKEPTQMSKMKHRLSRPVLHPGEVFRVKITHIENPQQFFAVKFAQLEDLASLENELDLEYSNNQSNPIYYAKLHMCCALLSEEKWYRGCIEEIKDHNNIRVRLVDNGRYVAVGWRELRVLKESFTNSPEFSIECSLADIQPLQENDYEWTQIAIAEFVRMSSNPNIQMIVSTSHQFRYQVIINVIKKHLDINIGAMLVKFKHALTTGEGSASIENVRKSKSPIDNFFINNEQNKQQTIGSSEVLSIRTLKRTPVQVIHIVNPGEFYIHLVEHIPGILKLHEELQLEQEKVFQSEDSLKDIDWQVNDHCMVLTSINDSASQQWYRGIVLRTDDYDPECPFVVFLRDKGLTIHDLSKKQLTTISNLFDRICNGAILCHLACLYPTSGMKTWSHSSTDEFSHNVTTFESLGATIQGETLNGSIPVVLWGLTTESNDALAPCTTKYININKNLAWAGLAHLGEKIDITLQMDKFVETELEQGQQTLKDWYDKFKMALEVFPECNETLESDAETSANSPYDFNQPIEEGTIITDWLPAEPIEKTLFTGYPTYVDDEAIVYLHDADKHSLLARMRAKINEIVELKSSSKSQIKIGQPCLARYHLDKSLYRGTVLGLLPDKRYEVHFVDYGNTETCDVEDLYTTTAFPNIPIQAVRFRIDGIKPRGSQQKFSVTVLDLIHGVIVDKLCAIRVSAGEEHNEIKKCSIRFDQNDLAVYLVQNRFASPVSKKLFKAASNMNMNKNPSHIIPTSVTTIEEYNSQDELIEFMKEQICDPTGDTVRKTEVKSPKESVAMFNPEEYKRMFDKMQNEKLYKSITDLDSESSPVLNEELDEKVDDDEDVVELEFSFKSNYWVTDPIARSEVGSNFETFDPMDTSSLLSNFSGIEAFKTPQLPSSVKSFYCDVAYARSSTILHIFPHLSELQYRQIELARRIQLVVRKISPLTHFEVKTPCLARYSKDKLWYRAIIRSHNTSTRQVKVFYVDFLNTEQVAEEYVRRCPKELLSFPLRTFEMKLFALKPNSKLREKDVKEAVKKCLSERTLYAKIMRDRGKIPEICLYKSKAEKEEPIYQDLIIQKYFSKE